MLCAAAQSLHAQDLDLNPTRPTIANSAAIQSQGALQVEIGYDGFRHSGADQQSVTTSFSYVPQPRLRLDFAWSPYSRQQTGANTNASGVGTIQAGGKVVLWKEDYHRPAPGIAIQYEAEFPTASSEDLQNRGQQIILLLNHHYAKDGRIDVILNGSLVQADCQTATGCTYGGQQSFALSYHLHPTTRLYAEVFGQNNSASNAPPGTYLFAGFYQKVNDSFGVDGGIRFGVSDGSAPVGLTLGVVFGKRLQTGPTPDLPIRH